MTIILLYKKYFIFFHRLAKKIGLGLLQTFRLQLIFALLWLPLSAYWGLAWPLLACLGNMIFGPVATLFLSLSSLLFFSQLLYQSPFLLSKLLNYCCSSWLTILSYAPSSSLYAHCRPSLYFFWAVVGAVGLMIHYRPLRPVARQVSALLFLFCVCWIFLLTKKESAAPIFTDIPCQGATLHAIYEGGQLSLIDKGALGRRVAVQNFVEYNLIPFIYKQWGLTHINNIILLSCNLSTLRALSALCSLISIDFIYLISWGHEDKKMSRAYKEFTTALQKTKTKLYRIGSAKKTISLTPKVKLFLRPTGEMLKKGNSMLPKMEVEYTPNLL